MDTPTAFELNPAVARWRAALAQSPAFQHANLDELESHLRDGILHWQGHGLSAEEAFDIASRRIGNAEALGREYAKVNAVGVWSHRLLWMLVGTQVIGSIRNVSGFAGTVAVLGGQALTLGGPALAISGTIIQMVTVAVICLSLYRWVIKGTGLSGHRMDWWLARPASSIAILCAASLAMNALNLTASFAMIKYYRPTEYGNLALTNMWAGYAHALLQLVLISATMVLLARRVRKSAQEAVTAHSP